MKESSAIFEGVLIDEDVDRRETIPNTWFVVNQTFRVQVTRMWKGKVAPRVVVSKMDIVEQCVGSRVDFKYTPILFAPGQRVIIYAKQDGQDSYSMLRLGYFFVGAGRQPSSLNQSYGPGNVP
ncbi:MAG: hypothetical protein WC856_21460 [Methylococcaceae bacterium]